MRTRNFSGDARSALDYASDTEAVQSPPRSVRSGRLRSGIHSRSNSLPRTFNREALLRHPELSMELDRLSDTVSDAGDRLSARHSHRGMAIKTLIITSNIQSFRHETSRLSLAVNAKLISSISKSTFNFRNKIALFLLYG